MTSTPFFLIEQLKRTGTFNMESDHFHDSYEIYYLVAGERHYYINDRVYAIQAGDLVFINKNQLHRTTSKGNATHERILINFEEAFLDLLTSFPQWQTICGNEKSTLFGGESFLLRLSLQEQGTVTDLLYAMLRESKEQLAGHMVYLQTLLVQLLILLSRIRAMKLEPVLPESSDKQRRVYSIIEFLNSHYAQRLTLEELAEHFYLSPTYLCRIFKQTTGFTIVEYLNYIRVRHAQELLVKTDWKVTRIAEETGFDSIAHFGRVFKQIVKRPPLQYRKQNQLSSGSS